MASRLIFALALVVVVLTATVAAVDLTAPAIRSDIIDEVNHNHNVSWLARANPRFDGLTIKDVVRMLGARPTSPENAPPAATHVAASIPDAFDARTQWPGCVHPVLDQGQCGSCWAFGASEALSDRFCIASEKAVDVVLSPQDLVSCDWEGNMGCSGGMPHLAWDYMEVKGIRTIDCLPYTSGGGTTGACPHKCKGSSQDDKRYKVGLFSTKSHHGVSSIATAIMEEGPIEGTFSVYEDFVHYSSGVYQHTTGSMLGGHAIKMVGWGVDKDSQKAYWIVQNSWGPDWGLDGFFWILKGHDECGIESGGVAGKPKL